MLICNTYVSSFTQVCLTKPQKKKKRANSTCGENVNEETVKRQLGKA